MANNEKKQNKRNKPVKEGKLIRALYKTPLRKYLYRLQRDMLLICPYDERTVYVHMGRIVAETVLINIIGIVGILALNLFTVGSLNAYAIASAVLLCTILAKEYVGFKLANLQEKINLELGLYLSQVKNLYRANRSIMTSITAASADFSYEIKRYADYMSQLLSADDAEREVKAFTTDSRKHPYLRMFLSLCYKCMTRGDVTDNIGSSVFCKSVEIIRTGLASDTLRTKEKRYKMSGLTLITVAPAMFMNVFKKWGLEFAAGTESFYNAYGYVFQICALAATWYIHKLIAMNKTAVSSENRNASKLYAFLQKKLKFQPHFRFSDRISHKLITVKSNTPIAVFYMKMFVWAVIGFLIGLSVMFYSNANNKTSILNTTNIESIVTTKATQQEVLDTVTSMSNKYKDIDMSIYADEYLLVEVDTYLTNVRSAIVKEAIVAEVRDRVAKYQAVVFTWQQLLIALAFSITGIVPLLELELLYSTHQSNKKLEVQLFQTLILIQKDFPTTTALSLLEAMESHANLFRPLLSFAINEFRYDTNKALHVLQIEKSQAFQSIVNSLLTTDSVGVQVAFAEMESDIAYTKQQKALDDTITSNKTKSALDFLSLIPAVICLGGYFFLPFILQSVGDVKGLLDAMSSMEI